MLDVPLKLSQQRSKQGRTTQFNTRQSLPVSRNYVLNTAYIWLRGVSIHREAVICRILTHVSWDSTKSKYRETSVSIIWLHHRTDIHNCCLILVRRAHIMETIWLSVATITTGVVNCGYKRYLPTRSQVVNKRGCFDHSVIDESELTSGLASDLFT